MKGRICIVTGANAGIGKETVKGLARQGATVVMACRSPERGQAARADVLGVVGDADVAVMKLDLASKASIEAFAREFDATYPALHVLLNNAGLISLKRTLTADGFETTFGVNHLGGFYLTHLLRGKLESSAPARVINVASDAHFRAKWDPADLQNERRYTTFGAYARSKLANVLYTRELARRLEGTGVTANCLHPGVIATNLFPLPKFALALMGLFTISEEQGADTSLHLATAPEFDRLSGGYYDERKLVTPSRDARDDAAAAMLWAESSRLLGLPEVAGSPA
ncbi:MAG: SDR family oxidoreductase [Candidatus Sericytochromatia bacterium]|nr:SDR family oxidoreductase [Candidatus Tanganyikabacteria bacterium]